VINDKEECQFNRSLMVKVLLGLSVRSMRYKKQYISVYLDLSVNNLVLLIQKVI